MNQEAIAMMERYLLFLHRKGYRPKAADSTTALAVHLVHQAEKVMAAVRVDV
jgi:hypothetical protein